MSSFKKKLSKIKFLKTVKDLVFGKPSMHVKRENFPGSKSYWEQRYKANKNSGSGSYGVLAEFKSEIINTFVSENTITNVLEFGCGDGHQLSLANYINYTGIDVSAKAIEICKTQFAEDSSKSFYLMEDIDLDTLSVELVLSLDVIYHLIEEQVYHQYMTQLFKAASKYVIIYSSNYEEEVDIHVKCRKFTTWIDMNLDKTWTLKSLIKNKYPYDSKDPNNTSMADFYIYEKTT